MTDAEKIAALTLLVNQLLWHYERTVGRLDRPSFLREAGATQADFQAALDLAGYEAYKTARSARPSSDVPGPDAVGPGLPTVL